MSKLHPFSLICVRGLWPRSLDFVQLQMCVTGSRETRKVKVIWEKWCNYFKEVPSLWYKANESCLLSSHRMWLNCCHTINVLPYFYEGLGLLKITSWGFSCNWKDDTPSHRPYFVLQHSFASFSLSSLSSNIFWRCFWTDALTLLIQPSVRAQSSIHSCYILILSLGSASGSSVKELPVWGERLGLIHRYVYRYVQYVEYLNTFLYKT